jgi:hypothetical protein
MYASARRVLAITLLDQPIDAVLRFPLMVLVDFNPRKIIDQY